MAKARINAGAHPPKYGVKYAGHPVSGWHVVNAWGHVEPCGAKNGEVPKSFRTMRAALKAARSLDRRKPGIIPSDSMRLDWLEREAISEPIVLHDLGRLTGPHYRGLGLKKTTGRSLRQAIDDLMRIAGYRIPR